MKSSSARLARLRLVATALALVGLQACSVASSRHTIAAPSNAVDFDVVDATSVVVLAGDQHSRGIFYLDSASGRVKDSFGVTREASSVVATPDSGVILGVGSTNGGKSVGALEFWNSRGDKTNVLGMPGAVRSVTEVVDGRLYALVGGPSNRAAVEVDAVHHSIMTSFPLEADVTKIALCRFNAHDYIVGERALGGLRIRDAADTNADGRHEVLVRDTVRAPSCGVREDAIYTISDELNSLTFALFAWPNTLRVSSRPIGKDAARIVATQDGGVAGSQCGG